LLSIYSLKSPRPLRSTLFPYTTLFRSEPTASEEATTEPGPDADVVLTTSVSVLNGAGVSGLAGDVAAVLQEAGFTSVGAADYTRSEEHTSELQSRENLVCRLLLEKKKI